MRIRSRILSVAALSALCNGVVAIGQQLPEPKAWTPAEDHQNMMDQLGIKSLRPGPSGNESAPNHANYDESLANPFPQLPGVLTLKNGKKEPVKVQVFDRIPYTGNEDIKVVLSSSDPKPAEQKPKGLLRFEVALKPGEEKKVSFSYTVTRPPTVRVIPQPQPPEEEGN